MSPAEQPSSPHDAERRQAGDRIKVIGVLVIALLILLLAFLRFGKTIPWAAR